MAKLANKLPLFFSVVCVPMMVSAHHSNAEWDPNLKREFEGEVANVVWRNPHVACPWRCRRTTAGKRSGTSTAIP